LESTAEPLLYLKQQLERKTASQEQVNQLVAKVDSAVFSVRAKAIDELADMLPEVEPFIQKALDEASSLEARRRLEPLLKTSAVPEGQLADPLPARCLFVGESRQSRIYSAPHGYDED
jgi:hypothetical protein